jgi:hypothetical protein
MNRFLFAKHAEDRPPSGCSRMRTYFCANPNGQNSRLRHDPVRYDSR